MISTLTAHSLPLRRNTNFGFSSLLAGQITNVVGEAVGAGANTRCCQWTELWNANTIVERTWRVPERRWVAKGKWAESETQKYHVSRSIWASSLRRFDTIIIFDVFGNVDDDDNDDDDKELCSPLSLQTSISRHRFNQNEHTFVFNVKSLPLSPSVSRPLFLLYVYDFNHFLFKIQTNGKRNKWKREASRREQKRKIE